MKDFYCKYILKNLWFHVLTIIAVGLLITSFIIPPTGEISPSVLQGIAELFAFASLGTVIKAIDRGAGAKIKHHDLEVEIGDKEEGQM